MQDHYDSFTVHDLMPTPFPTIVLVDDFITKGRTMIAACSRVSESFPDHDVRAFTIFRTRGFVDVEAIIEPFEGTISFNGDDANRGD